MLSGQTANLSPLSTRILPYWKGRPIEFFCLGVPKRHFHLYLKEIGWRFNHQNETLVKLLKKYLNQRVVKEQFYYNFDGELPFFKSIF